MIMVQNRPQLAELQQYLPIAVCDEGCEAAEERSDDAALVFLTYNYISITKRAVLSVL